MTKNGALSATYRICNVAQTRALEVPRQTPIVPKLRAASIRPRRALIPPKLPKRSLHKREHLLRDHRARRARHRMQDVRELKGGQDEPAALGLAFPRLARDELFERYRLARDALPQFRDLRHELQALGLVLFAAQLDKKRRDAIRVHRL